MSNENLDWYAVAARMRADLDRAVLNERPRLVCIVLVTFTLMKRRTKVILPDREGLCALLGIGKNHMASVWRECAAARIAKFRRVALGWEVLIFPDSRQWSVDWVWAREELARFADFVERVPGQAQGELIPPDATVDEAMAEVAVESSGSQVGNQTLLTVPKKGTGSQKGNQGGLGGRTSNYGSGVFELQSSMSQSFLKSSETLNSEKRSTEGELVQRCREVFGEDQMEAYGARWRARARENPGKLSRVLDDTQLAMREGRIRTVAVAYANATWKYFK